MIENDRYNPSLKLCINIAKELNVTLNDLFWEDKMVSKLFNVKDEYQLEKFNRLFAKISALVSILMLALLYFEAIFDVERSYLSPYLIGVLLCLIVLACMLMTNGYSEESKEIYVRNEEEKSGLKNEFKNV